MIRIDKYAISAYDRGYIFVVFVVFFYKETKEVTERINKPSYYSNIQRCLAKIRMMMHLEVINQYDGDLSGACLLLAKTDERFEALVTGIEKHGS